MSTKHTLTKLSLVALLSLGLGAGSLSQVVLAEESSASSSQMPDDKQKDEMNQALVGQLMGQGKHKVMGMAKVTAKEVVLTGFSSDEAPDLNAYLTKDGDVEHGLKLGKVDAKGAIQGYKLDKVDLSQYNTLTIHCDQVNETFGSAMLTKFSDGAMDQAMKRMGELMGANGKMVMGSVSIEKNQLKLSNFKSDKAPDLHVLLSKDGKLETAVEVGAVDSDMMEQSYDLNGLKADGYNKVFIYCVEAHEVFGQADLK